MIQSALDWPLGSRKSASMSGMMKACPDGSHGREDVSSGVLHVTVAAPDEVVFWVRRRYPETNGWFNDLCLTEA
jgi:hypothetical protein